GIWAGSSRWWLRGARSSHCWTRIRPSGGPSAAHCYAVAGQAVFCGVAFNATFLKAEQAIADSTDPQVFFAVLVQGGDRYVDYPLPRADRDKARALQPA